MKSASLLLLCATGITLASCSSDVNLFTDGPLGMSEESGVTVVLVNDTEHDVTDIRPTVYEGFEHVSPFAAGEFPDVPSGKTIRVSLPADTEFAWGDPAPTGLDARVDGCLSTIGNGQWCGTGYFEGSAEVGTYMYHLVELDYSSTDWELDPELRYVFLNTTPCEDRVAGN